MATVLDRDPLANAVRRLQRGATVNGQHSLQVVPLVTRVRAGTAVPYPQPAGVAAAPVDQHGRPVSAADIKRAADQERLLESIRRSTELKIARQSGLEEGLRRGKRSASARDYWHGFMFGAVVACGLTLIACIQKLQ